jgi:hypothetical protein
MSQATFEISYTPALRPLFGILGIGPRYSRIEVTGQRVRVQMGWAFGAEFSRSAIRSLEPDGDRVTGWGVHGWGGSWLVNGSSSGLIRFELDPPAPARAVGIPVGLEVLRVSVEDPEGLLRVLGRG